MLASTLTTLLASCLFVLADPIPTAPGPQDSFAEGTDCAFAWAGDASGGATWKTMNVELMSGSNFGMIHLTTVATDLDGTATGTHSYPCPDVTPNSAIYFYQFSSPLSANVSWTTRFTIADKNGQSTPPTEATQPTTGAPTPWGTGALDDPSTAVSPPTIGGGGANSTASSSSSLSVPSGSNSTTVTSSLTSTTSSTTSSLAVTTATSKTSSSSSNSGSTGSSTSSSSSAASSSNDAHGLVVVDSRARQSVVALGAAAFAFTVLL